MLTYRIVEKAPFTIVGVKRRFHADTGYREIPKFWEECLAQGDDSLKKVLQAGQLVLGLDTEFPPMGFIDETGEIVGFDIDVAREVCSRLGVTLVPKGIDWDHKEEELNSGAIDCIWNGMSVTPERAAAMNLSEPYMNNEQIFVVLGDSDVKEMQDLIGRRVGVQVGSTSQEALEASALYADVVVVASETHQENVRKLKEGEVDAILVDSVAAFYSVFSSDQLYYILPESLGQEEYAIGAHWHHERYDGSGYPDGLAGTAISEEARIIAVADAYDAMTSRRSYRDVLSQETVRREIEAGKGTQFDPAFADFMLQMIDEDRDYRLRGQ